MSIFNLTNGAIFDMWAIMLVFVCWVVYKLYKHLTQKKYKCLLCDMVVYGEPACKNCNDWFEDYTGLKVKK